MFAPNLDMGGWVDLWKDWMPLDSQADCDSFDGVKRRLITQRPLNVSVRAPQFVAVLVSSITVTLLVMRRSTTGGTRGCIKTGLERIQGANSQSGQKLKGA